MCFFLFVVDVPNVHHHLFRFADNMEGLFKTLCLQHMPPNMQNIDRKKSGEFFLNHGKEGGVGEVANASS